MEEPPKLQSYLLHVLPIATNMQKNYAMKIRRQLRILAVPIEILYCLKGNFKELEIRNLNNCH